MADRATTSRGQDLMRNPWDQHLNETLYLSRPLEAALNRMLVETARTARVHRIGSDGATRGGSSR